VNFKKNASTIRIQTCMWIVNDGEDISGKIGEVHVKNYYKIKSI